MGELTMFGKTFNTIGSSDSNFIIKTKGDVKILWGGKFIDLIKNGKIASSNTTTYFKIVDSIDDITGNGIYIIPKEDGDEAWVSIDGNNILLNSTGELFISFLEELKLTSELKDIALTNIGFNYNSLEEAKSANIKAGLVYIKDLSLLFIIKDGTITEYKVTTNIGNTFNRLKIGDIEIFENFIISAESLNIGIGTSSQIVLKDKYTLINGDLVINSGTIMSIGATSTSGFRLYEYEGTSVLEVDNVIIRKSLELPSNYILVRVEEFRTLIEYEDLQEGREYRLYDFRNFWQLGDDEILTEDGIPERPSNVFPLIVKAKNGKEYYWDKCFFESDVECIVTYDVTYNKVYIINDLRVLSLGLITNMRDKYGNECNYNFKHLRFFYNDVWNYTFGNEDTYNLYSNNTINLSEIRVAIEINDGILVLEDFKNHAIITKPCHGNTFAKQTTPLYLLENFNNNTILNNWNPKLIKAEINNCLFKKDVKEIVINNSLKNCIFEDEFNNVTINAALESCTFKKEVKNITINSVLDNCIFEYSTNTDLLKNNTLVFKNCKFLSVLPLVIVVPDSKTITQLQSDESKLVTVYLDKGENKLRVLSNEFLRIPSGVILMWGGLEIPYGWAICDGENGTPNLIGRFIKAVGITNEVGEITSVLNEKNELTIKLENLPKHSHPHLPHTHELLLPNMSGTTENSETLDVSLLWSDYNYGIKSTTETVVTSVIGEGVTTETGLIESVSNIRTQGGRALGGVHAHTFKINVGEENQSKKATSVETVPTDIEWPNKAVKIEPRSYALIFIMKL